MSELTPITRVESYLDAIVNSGIPPTEDITRIETFLQAIYDNTVCQLTPITRIEMFLGKISGQDIVLPEPITRIELYLAAIAGEDVELSEEPITRIEMYLADWADSGDWTTISGAIVEFITQRAHKLKSCVVSLSPIQDLSHGDPSPTNICPISGWTGCEVWRDGKNLLNLVESEMVSTGWNRRFPISLKAGTYIISCVNQFGDPSALGAAVSLTDENDQNIVKSLAPGYNFGNSVLVGDAVTLTDAEAASVKWIRFSLRAGGVTYAEIVRGNIQLELGSTAAAYEEFKGNSYSVTWEDEAGTVYGGTVDLVSGVLTVNRAYVEYDGSQDEDWGTYGQPSDPNFCCVIYPSGKAIGYQKSKCNEFKNVNSAYGNPAYGIYSDHPNLTNTYFRMPNADVNSRNEFMAWLANNPIQFVYELATPITIQLTPQQIASLKGYNAIWSDAGTVEVTAYGTPIVEPNVPTRQALNLLLGGAYHNNHTPEDVSDEEALNIITGGADR